VISRSVIWISCLLLSATSGGPANAQDLAHTPAIALREAAREALANNPELLSARESIAIAQGRLMQAGLWPNPELALGGGSDFAFRDDGERQLSGAIAQRLPISGRLGRAREVARVDVAAAVSEARDFERILIGDVQETVIRVMELDRSIATWNDVIEPAQELARLSKHRLDAAEVSEVDLNLILVQIAGFEQEQRQLEIERQSEAIALNRLLQRPIDEPVVMIDALEEVLIVADPLDDPIKSAMERRPDLVAALLLIDRASAETKLARAEAWEDWSFGVGVESDKQVFADEPVDDPIGIKRDEFLRFEVSVPLPLWNRNQGSVAAAMAERRRAVASVEALKQRISAEIKTARSRALQLLKLHHNYEEATLPRVRRNVAMLTDGYRQGLSPAFEVVQAAQQLADAELRRIRILGDIRRAENDFETASAANPLLEQSPGAEEKP
jgi:cobalt-zinc-cadmium efflux system outer membrane protein